MTAEEVKEKNMKFCGLEIPDNYYRGKKFITIHEITKMYNLDNSSKVSNTIRRMRDEMEEGVDYFHLTCVECSIINGISHTKPMPKGQRILTESGYKKLLPKFEAWKDNVKPTNVSAMVDGFEKLDEQINKTEEIKVEEKPVVEVAEKPKEIIIPAEPEVVEENFGVTTSATVTNVNFTEMVGLMNKTLDMLAGVIRQQSEDHKEMVRQLNENNTHICELIIELSRLRQNKVNDDYIVSIEPTDYQSWKKQINMAVDKIAELTGQQKNEVLSECYKLLTKEYGYVFDDIAKKFYKEYNRGPINKLENVWYGERTNPAYKNLMIAKLSTMYKEAEKNAEQNS